jgi:TolA-binding protein
MLRSARSTRIAQTFTLPTIAIIAAACGGEVKNVKEVVGDSANPVATITVPGPTVSSTGTVVSNTPTQAVSIAEGEKVFQEKRYADAAALFSTYVDQHPNNPWGHYMLGLSSWKAGDLERAESAFVRANEIDPKHVKTLLNMGIVRAFGKQDLEGAAKAWEEVVAIAPNSQEGQAAKKGLEGLRNAHAPGTTGAQ